MCSKDKEVGINQSWGASKDNAQYEAELTATMVTLICITRVFLRCFFIRNSGMSDTLGEPLRAGVGGDYCMLCTVDITSLSTE